MTPNLPSFATIGLASGAPLGLDRRVILRRFSFWPPFLFRTVCGIACWSPAFTAETAPNPRFTGTPLFTAWTSEDYGGAPITLQVVQHPQTGFVYVGNTLGVLEFDGATWRLIRSPSNRVVPMVVVDTAGTIWFGGSNEVAILRPDARGELQAVDVTARLPAAERNFGRIYLGATAPDGVYLAGPSRLLFFGHDGSARSWRPGTTNFNGLCWHDGALHASLGAAGLARLEGGTLVPVAPAPHSPNPAIADTLRLFAIRAEPGDRGALLLTNIGPMRWAGPGQPLEPLTLETQAEFARESATTATFLPDGRLAFSLPRRGLVILEASGAVSTLLDRARGLGDGRIDHIATDNQGGLWLARLNGLARLQIDSRFALHGDFDATRDMLRHGSRLYVAHYQGAAWRDDATGDFHSIADLPAGLKSLLNIGDRVFGTGQFLYEITADNRAVVALPLSLNGLIALRNAPGFFAGASVAGLRLLRCDDRGWHDVGLVAGIDGNVRAVLEEPDGWLRALGYHGSGSWRVDFREGARLSADVEFFDEASTLSHRRSLPSITVAGELRAVPGNSFRDDRTPLQRHSANRPAEAERPRVSLGPASVDRTEWQLIRSSPPEVVSQPATGTGSRTDLDVLRTGPLRTLVPKLLFTDAATRTLWLGGQGGMVSIDPAWRAAQAPAPLQATIRRLATADGELLWSHGWANPSNAPKGRPLALDSAQNTLRFTFAAPVFAPDYRGVSHTVYRTRLEGLEKTWTTWSTTPWREFTALPYRAFVLHVQARDIDDRESTVGTLAFAIAPPWFLAPWAIVAYALSGLAAIASFFQHRTAALRRRAAQLEGIVTERTRELARSNAELAASNTALGTQNLELARLNQLELDKKISAQLAEEKARLEVLRYQLNPHFLFNSLNSIYTLVWSHSRPAGDLVRRLAEFCRMTLTRGGADTATLIEEFTMLRAYLDLERSRWQEQLLVEIHLAPEAEATQLPPFLLLPLVENAMKYGGHTSPEILRIRVTARPEADGRITIEIANTGTWVEPGSVPEIASTKIGLDNLRQRLARHYPGAHEFTTEAKDGWVIARLRLDRVSFSQS